MAKLTLSSSLVNLIPHEQRIAVSRKTVSLNARSWQEVVVEIQENFPMLAKRVLTESGDISPAFVLVINDEVTRVPHRSLRLGPDDDVCLLAAIAGGS